MDFESATKIANNVDLHNATLHSYIIVDSIGKYGLFATKPDSQISIMQHIRGEKPSPYVSASNLPSGSATFKTTEKIQEIDKFIKNVKRDKEVLIRDSKQKSSSAVFTKQGKSYAQAIIVGEKILLPISIFFSIENLTQATYKSIQTNNPKPIIKASSQEIGGWTCAWLGFKGGAVVGATVSATTGVGAMIGGLLGGIVGGIGGYLGADFMVELIYE